MYQHIYKCSANPLNHICIKMCKTFPNNTSFFE